MYDRFVAAPGRATGVDALADLESCFLFGGEMLTGPPSFLLISAQSCGNRAAKLM